MKYCKNCGQEIGNDKVCANCGHKNKCNKTIKAVVAIICCISIITVGVLGVLRFSNKDTISNTNSDYVFFTEGFTDVLITDEKSAIEAVASVGNILGIKDASSELKVVFTNIRGTETYYRLQQCYNNIPVFGRNITVVADENGKPLALTANYLHIEDIDTEPSLNEEKVKEKITKAYGGVDSQINNGLIVYTLYDSTPTLAYDVIVSKSNENNLFYEQCIISAENGDVLFENNLIRTDIEHSLDEYTYKVNDKTYLMYDASRNILVLNSNKKLLDYKIIDKDNTEYLAVSNDGKTNENDNPLWDKNQTLICGDIKIEGAGKAKWKDDAVDLINSIENTYDFYSTILNWNGYDNKNSPLLSSYNDFFYSKGNNAYSQGNLLVFGYEKDLTDVGLIGHEFTHSVEGSISGMLYSGESGAIMEAYSDIFGELAEDYAKDGMLNGDCDWIHGSRNMINPSVNNYPACYLDDNWKNTSDTGSDSDYGNVHTNNTVISHAAYLMSSGVNENAKIDNKSLAVMWFNALNMLQRDSELSQCRNAVELSARIMLKNEQLTQEQYKTVKTAFDMVGIENATFTYHNTVENKFDLSVLSVEGKEEVSCKLDVVKMVTPESGPRLIMDDVVITGRETLELEDGSYCLSITDEINNEDTQTINIKIVVDGNDSDATDEVIVYTDFTDVITVVLDYTTTDETSAVFKSGDSLVYVGDKIIYAKNDGIYYRDNPTSSENKIASTQKDHTSPQNARNLLSDGETVFFTVNPGASADNFGAYYQQDEVYSVKANGENLSKLFKTEGDVKLVTCYDDYLFYLNNHDSNYGYSGNQSDYMLNKYNIATGENVEFSNSDLGISNGDSIGDFVSFGTKIYLEASSSGGSYDSCDIIEFDTKSSKANNVLQNAHIVSPSTNAQQGVVCFETSGDNDWYIYSVDSSGKMTKSEKIPSRLTLSQGVISSDGSFALMRSDTNESDFDLHKVYLKTGKIEVIKNGAGCFKNKGAGLTYDEKHKENIYCAGPGGANFKFNGSGYDKVETEGDIASLNYWLIDGCFIATQDYSDFTWNTINEVKPEDNNKQISIDEDWKTLYIDYVNSMNEAYEDIYIAYIDDDNIPELYVIGKYHMAGASLCWIDNGAVKFQACAQNFGFKERSEKCYAYTMQMGVSKLTEYTLSNGRLTEKEIASCSENDGTYTWNDTDVSKDDFWSKHQDYISNYTTPTYTDYTKREDFKTVIQSY